jgi:hypothetical protein
LKHQQSKWHKPANLFEQEEHFKKGKRNMSNQTRHLEAIREKNAFHNIRHPIKSPIILKQTNKSNTSM